MAVQGRPMLELVTLPCTEARVALIYALVGLLCCGIILEPIAIIKAIRAGNMIAENPRLTGSGMAIAALTIAILGLVLWAIGIIFSFSR